MNRAGGCAVVLAALTLAIGTAAATPAFIERQQSTYATEREQWITPELPGGVDTPARPRSAYDSGVDGVWLRIHDTTLRFRGDIGLHALDVTAKLKPDVAGAPVDLDHPARFSVEIQHGCVRLTTAQLTALFNTHILDYTPRPLNDLDFTAGDDTLAIDGEIKFWSWFPGFWMPLYLNGPLRLEQGELVYRPDRIDALHIRGYRLLHLARISLNDLLSIDRPGVTVNDYAIRLDTTRLFPPPAIDTAPGRVEVDSDGVTICFGERPDIMLDPPADAGSRYIWIQAGDLVALDKLIVNAHVLVRPQSGHGLVFDIPNYRAQIAEGQLGMRRDGTLTVTLPPVTDSPRRRR